MKKILILLMTVTIILVGCSNNLQGFNSTPKNLEELLPVVNAYHKSNIKPKVNFEEYISDYKPENVKWSNEYENIKYNKYDILLSEDIKYDINYLFESLKNAYGLYNYFGGDEVFNKSKNNLLSKYNNADSISVESFLTEIKNELSFIKDYHFSIYGERANEIIVAYIFDEHEFELVNGKYINKTNNKVVLSVNKNEDLNDIFKLSITANGELVYYPIILSDGIVGSINIEYVDGTKDTLIYSKNNFTYNFNEELKLEKKSDIPIIKITKMGFDQSPVGQNAKKFLEYAEEYKDEPIVILDLRNNTGGNALLPLKWMKNYASEYVPTNYSSLKYLTLNQLVEYSNPNYYNYQPINEISEIYGLEQISNNYSKALDYEDKFISNDNLLVILVNKNTASAAEMIVDLAHNVENTLIVGTNTAGCLIGDITGFITLPKSNIPVTLGTGLCFFHEDYFQEFVGFMPDLWVNGDAEEAVLNFILNTREDD